MKKKHITVGQSEKEQITAHQSESEKKRMTKKSMKSLTCMNMTFLQILAKVTLST